jgi:exopolysaccharide production protein ExoQ
MQTIMYQKNISEYILSRRNFFNICELIFGIIGLLFFAGAFSAGLSNFYPSFLQTIIRYSVLFGSATILLLNWRAALYRSLRGFWIWLLIGLMFLSASWSVTPTATVTQLRAELLPMTIFSLYLSTRFSLPRLFELICIVLGLGTLVSFFLAILMPQVAIHGADSVHAGAWKGVYIQKNTFGAYTVLAANIFYLRAIYAKRRKLFEWGLLGLIIGVILLSQSKTALTLTTVSLFTTTLYNSFRWRGKRSILFLDLLVMIMSGLIIFLIQSWTNLLEFLERGENLSGRTEIWSKLLTVKIPQRLWFGYGRGAFWPNANLTQGMELGGDSVPAHAHNGFLEMILDVGMIGFILFVVCLYLLYIRSLRLSYSSRVPYEIWPLVFLTLLIFNNITESLLTFRVNLFWILFVVLSFSIDNKRINQIKLSISK